MKMTFAEKLKNARREANMTQKELAEASHLALRTIINYETGGKYPKKESTYNDLAHALGITGDSLKDETCNFVVEAGKNYGGRGSRQAEEIIRAFRVAAAGGELDDNDLDFIRDAMMQTYWDAKNYNQRFVNRRYLPDENEKKQGDDL